MQYIYLFMSINNNNKKGGGFLRKFYCQLVEITWNKHFVNIYKASFIKQDNFKYLI